MAMSGMGILPVLATASKRSKLLRAETLVPGRVFEPHYLLNFCTHLSFSQVAIYPWIFFSHNANFWEIFEH